MADPYRFPREKTKQEIFDEVATHLLNQGVQATDDKKNCRFRDAKGNMCAIGRLIDPTHEWALQLQGGYGQLRDEYPIYWVPQELEEFLYELQEIHDAVAPEVWPDHLSYLAEQHGLNSNAIPKKEPKP